MENFSGFSHFIERFLLSNQSKHRADSVHDDLVVPLTDHEWFEKYGTAFPYDWEQMYAI